MVFDAEKLLMSNSFEIKWAIDNNSFNNKNNFIKNAFNQRASFFSLREGLVSHCPSDHSLNPPLITECWHFGNDDDDESNVWLD